MASQNISARPAHPEGQTTLCYTPNGQHLVTVGVNSTLKIFKSGSRDEPLNIDDCPDSNTIVVCSNEHAFVGSENGHVIKYSLATREFEEILYRCTLPIRDLALSPDGQWLGIVSDETKIFVVNVSDMQNLVVLTEPKKALKHVSFDPTGKTLVASCTDGDVYIYSFGEAGVSLLQTLRDVVPKADSTSETSIKAYWHPDGRAFALPTPTRDMQVISTKSWARQRVFRSGHTGDITAAAWSPNGALLASAAMDKKINLWDTKTQTIIHTFDQVRRSILCLAWHPKENVLSYTDSNGELFIHSDFIPQEHVALLHQGLQPAPFIHDPLSETSGNAQRKPYRYIENGLSFKNLIDHDAVEDEVDSILNDFVDDDDEGGYAEPTRKRSNAHLEDIDVRIAKRRAAGQGITPEIHESFHPGSSQWQGDRRWLCINLVGTVLAIDNAAGADQTDQSYSIEIRFLDEGNGRRPIKFKDYKLYDKACLNEKGVLFSCEADEDKGQLATLHYRPLEPWTTEKRDWFVELPKGERITSMALTDSFAVVTTSASYVRIYTIFGVPFRIYRHKASPSVTCAAWRDYVLTIGNGPLGSSGRPQLLYTIENVKRDEVFQSEDIVALPSDAELQSVFFSDKGDPCIYDSTGTLLVLLHWRSSGQARWVPLLDTNQLDRKNETYWPVAVHGGKFWCYILKGSQEDPPHPLPPVFDFAFKVPGFADSAAADESKAQIQQLRDNFVLQSTEIALMEDYLAATRPTADEKRDLSKRLIDVDSTLIRMLAQECLLGEENAQKGLDVVKLMRDSNGKMLEAAVKVAQRYEHETLAKAIEELYESRMVGLAGDDDE